MKRMILLVLILLVFTVGCAYKPEGSPVLIVENISWEKTVPKALYITIYYTIKNIGTSDNTMLKDKYYWSAYIPFKVIFTNGVEMTTQCNTGKLFDMGGGAIG